mmetsp:Transcript_15317/g.31560  ORF Transcript_15317/g.31560 Transcript_15317/m.31560 type:complete len:290 (+) Transcript_15317:476-1345(+)
MVVVVQHPVEALHVVASNNAALRRGLLVVGADLQLAAVIELIVIVLRPTALPFFHGPGLKVGPLVLHDLIHEHLESLWVDLLPLGEVPTHLGERVCVDVEHQGESTGVNGEVGTVREEVVPHKHAEENEVVNNSISVNFKVKLQGITVPLGELAELQVEHFSEDRELQELEIFPPILKHVLGFSVPVPAFPPPRHYYAHLLPQQHELGLVAHQPKHDKVRVETVEDVLKPSVLVPVRVVLLTPTDVVHNLVLALSWNIGTRKHHGRAIFPERVSLNLVLDPLVHGKTKL